MTETVLAKLRRDRLPRAHAVEVINGLGFQHALDELGENDIAFARYRGIDEAELTKRLRSHDAFRIRASEHDERIRKRRLDTLGERERCDMLLEDAGETDDARRKAGDGLEAFIEKSVDEPPSANHLSDL